MTSRLILFVVFLCVLAEAGAQPSAFCLLEEAEAYRLTEEHATARQRYLAALPYYKRQQDVYHQAYIYWALSDVSYYLDETDRGLEEVLTALQLAETHFQVDTLSYYCSILQNAGIFYSLKGDYEKQMAFYRRTYSAALSAHGWYSPQVADAYSSLGIAYGRRSNWSNCIHHLDTSLHIANVLHYREGQAVGMINISYAYAMKGDLTRAIRAQKQALTVVTTDELRATGLNNLGTLYIDVKDYPKAMECLQQALDIRRKMGGANRKHYLSSRLNIIYAQFESGQQAAATAKLDSLITEMDRLPSPPLKSKQIALNYKAGMMLELGDYERALTAIDEAEQVSYDGVGVKAGTFYVRGKILYAMERYDEALVAVHNGFDVLLPAGQRSVSPDGFDWKALANEEYGRSLLVLKGMLLREKAIATGQSGLLHQSLQSLQIADSLVTNSRLSFTSRVSKQIMMADAKPLYNELLNTLYELFKLEKKYAYVAQAFHYMEKNKAFSVLENLNDIQARAFHDVPSTIVEQERTLRENIDYYNTELAYATDSQLVVAVENKLNELRQEQQILLDNIGERYPRYYQTRLQLVVSKLDTVQHALLYPGESLVEYYLSDEHAFVVTAHENDAALHKLPAPGLSEKVSHLLEATKSQSSVKAISHKLCQMLIAPLRPHLRGNKLLVVPDGVINYIPFDPLLVDTTGTKPYYLMEDFSIRRILSASTTMKLRSFRAPSASGQILAFAPDFTSGASPDREGSSLSPLPGAQLELDSLANLFDGYYLRDEEATEQALKHCKDHRGVLHLATHTAIDNQLPIASSLLLRGGGGQDGKLRAYEIYRIALSAELAFLSACNTGYGKITAGEGSVSLAHAFAYAGCPNLVMTLWPVRDRTTPTLVSAYYRYLQRGYDKAEALRQAKLFYLEFEPLNDHPYYWSGFTYLGDREPLRLQSGGQPGTQTAIILWALLLLSTIVFTAYLLTRPWHS